MKQTFYSFFLCASKVEPGDGFDSCRTRMLFEYEWKFGLIKMLIVNALAEISIRKIQFQSRHPFSINFLYSHRLKHPRACKLKILVLGLPTSDHKHWGDLETGCDKIHNGNISKCKLFLFDTFFQSHSNFSHLQSQPFSNFARLTTAPNFLVVMFTLQHLPDT